MEASYSVPSISWNMSSRSFSNNSTAGRGSRWMILALACYITEKREVMLRRNRRNITPDLSAILKIHHAIINQHISTQQSDVFFFVEPSVASPDIFEN